jgi:hypothetical protein
MRSNFNAQIGQHKVWPIKTANPVAAKAMATRRNNKLATRSNAGWNNCQIIPRDQRHVQLAESLCVSE